MDKTSNLKKRTHHTQNNTICVTFLPLCLTGTCMVNSSLFTKDGVNLCSSRTLRLDNETDFCHEDKSHASSFHHFMHLPPQQIVGSNTSNLAYRTCAHLRHVLKTPELVFHMDQNHSSLIASLNNYSSHHQEPRLQ